MKLKKIAVILMFLASTAVFAAQNQFASAISTQRRQPLIAMAKGGPGPLCWPGTPCWLAAKDGPGPLCWPGTPCQLGAKGGPGPLCWPGDPCRGR